MRYCLVSTQEHWGGGEALLAAIASELRRLGHSVSCIVRHGGPVEQRMTAAGAELLHATRKRGSNLSDWLATGQALKNWSPDVIVLNDTHAVPLIGSAVWFSRAPKPIRLAMKHTVFKLHSPFKYRLLCDKLICVSEAALQTVLSGGLPASHAVVIHGGCQLVTSDPSSRQAVRAEHQLTPDQFLIVSVGSLLDCKGHRELIDALARLADSHPHLVALIAGEGEERSNLERQILEAGLSSRVRLLGYRDDAQRLLDGADLVVHPSHAEGLSLVLIQAQMLETPVVATAVGGTKEVLAAETANCSSWIAQPGDAHSLATCIAQAHDALLHPSDDLQRKLQATAERMRQRFSIQATTREVVRLSAQMLQSRQPGLPVPG